SVSAPVKTSLNCTMPELVKSNVGSLPGTSDEEATIWCPFDSKKERNFWRISEVFIAAVCSVHAEPLIIPINPHRDKPAAVLPSPGAGRNQRWEEPVRSSGSRNNS